MTKRFCVLAAASSMLLAGCVSEGTYNAQVADTQAETALATQYAQLNTQLQGEIAANQVQIKQLQGKLVVTFVDEILFASGSADVHSSGRAVLNKAVPTLAALQGNWIKVQGYTDNEPIGPSLRGRYATNWDLSTARATDVVKYLQSQGVPPTNLVAEGFGEFQPVVDNSTPANRAKNRRIEVVLQSK